MRVKTNHLWILFALLLALAMSGGILWLTQLAAVKVLASSDNFLTWLLLSLPMSLTVWGAGIALCCTTPMIALSLVGEERMAELKGENGVIPWKEFLNDPPCLVLCGSVFSLVAWKWFGSDFAMGGMLIGMVVVAYGVFRLLIESRKSA